MSGPSPEPESKILVCTVNRFRGLGLRVQVLRFRVLGLGSKLLVYPFNGPYRSPLGKPSYNPPYMALQGPFKAAWA